MRRRHVVNNFDMAEEILFSTVGNNSTIIFGCSDVIILSFFFQSERKYLVAHEICFGCR